MAKRGRSSHPMQTPNWEANQSKRWQWVRNLGRTREREREMVRARSGAAIDLIIVEKLVDYGHLWPPSRTWAPGENNQRSSASVWLIWAVHRGLCRLDLLSNWWGSSQRLSRQNRLSLSLSSRSHPHAWGRKQALAGSPGLATPPPSAV